MTDQRNLDRADETPRIPVKHEFRVDVTQVDNGWEARATLASPNGTLHFSDTTSGSGSASSPDGAIAAACSDAISARERQ